MESQAPAAELADASDASAMAIPPSIDDYITLHSTPCITDSNGSGRPSTGCREALLVPSGVGVSDSKALNIS